LPEIINVIKKSGNVSSLYTNGIRISDFNYLKRLYNSGLRKIHLQFDTFDDGDNKVLRGKSILNKKIVSLENIKNLNMDVILEVTLVGGVNTDQIEKIVDFAKTSPSIKAIQFMSYDCIGKAGFKHDSGLDAWKIVDMAEKQCDLKLKDKILEFQKIFYIINHIIDGVVCPNILYLVFLRKNSRIIPITDFFNFSKIKKLNKNIFNKKTKNLIKLYTLIFLLKTIKFKSIKILLKIAPIIITNSINKRLDTNLSKDFLVIGFGGQCDFYNLDLRLINSCGQGEISTNYGIIKSRMAAKLIREKTTRSS